jgi:hypothetical protein
MARDEIGKCAKARDPDSFAFEIADARNRGGGEKRCLPLIVLASHHDEIRTPEIGVDHRAGGRIYDVDIAAEQGLDGFGTRADVQKLHVRVVFLIHAASLPTQRMVKVPVKAV